jgi:spore maturation protein CgeB
LKILYIGHSPAHTTSRHRADALVRIGAQVIHRDPYRDFRAILNHEFWGKLHYRSGFRLLQPEMERWTLEALEESQNIDLVWVDGGELLGPGVLKILKRGGVPLVFFNIDNPTGSRDGRRFDLARAALPLYDLGVTVRSETESDMRLLGVPNVLKVWRAYDEVRHAPFSKEMPVCPALVSDVAFIGAWMANEKRDEFLFSLLAKGIPIAIWGERWEKAPNWARLSPFWRGPFLTGMDYVAAVQNAKIALGLLSKGNRDLHTLRSMEIPFAGGLLCAERTSEHLELYENGEEAVFWQDADECAEVCHKLLANPKERERIRNNGNKKVRELGVGNEDVARKVLAAVASFASH